MTVINSAGLLEDDRQYIISFKSQNCPVRWSLFLWGNWGKRGYIMYLRTHIQQAKSLDMNPTA
jgi:hypothetical protein